MFKDEFCSEDVLVPLVKLFEKKMLNQNLSMDEIKKVTGFSLDLTYLEAYGSVNDKSGIEYVSNFFSYFCNKYNNYFSLPNEVKLSFDVAYFSDTNTLMNVAYNASTCTSDFEAQ